MLLPRWFLSLNGVGLLVLGGTMLFLRLRAGEAGLAALRSTRALIGLLWSLLCCAAGVVLLLMAAGRLDQPGAVRPPHPHAAPLFPVDR